MNWLVATRLAKRLMISCFARMSPSIASGESRVTTRKLSAKNLGR